MCLFKKIDLQENPFGTEEHFFLIFRILPYTTVNYFHESRSPAVVQAVELDPLRPQDERLTSEAAE